MVTKSRTKPGMSVFTLCFFSFGYRRGDATLLFFLFCFLSALLFLFLCITHKYIFTEVFNAIKAYVFVCNLGSTSEKKNTYLSFRD